MHKIYSSVVPVTGYEPILAVTLGDDTHNYGFHVSTRNRENLVKLEQDAANLLESIRKALLECEARGC